MDSYTDKKRHPQEPPLRSVSPGEGTSSSEPQSRTLEAAERRLQKAMERLGLVKDLLEKALLTEATERLGLVKDLLAEATHPAAQLPQSNAETIEDTINQFLATAHAGVDDGEGTSGPKHLVKDLVLTKLKNVLLMKLKLLKMLLMKLKLNNLLLLMKLKLNNLLLKLKQENLLLMELKLENLLKTGEPASNPTGEPASKLTLKNLLMSSTTVKNLLLMEPASTTVKKLLVLKLKLKNLPMLKLKLKNLLLLKLKLENPKPNPSHPP